MTKPLTRKPVNKSGSAKQFHRVGGHTKAINLQTGMSRGGIRL